MLEDHRLSKIQILLQQRKYAEAEQILKDLLSSDSNNSDLLYLLAEVKLQQEDYDSALSIIDGAIALSPDSAHLFYNRARIYMQMDKFAEAEENIRQSIAYDPYDADYYALLASITLGRKKYEEALGHADHALEIDAENLLALNVRSTALLKLDKKEESFTTIEGALREDPNNSYTHANYGWGLLEKGDHRKALTHFQESLKSDPTNNYAQAGMLEAIKARNPVYRLFLRYSFFMGNLTAKYQWGLIIGFYLGMKALRFLAASNEGLQPYLVPLIIALTIILFSTWVMDPICNLFLRFNKYGKLLLDKNEKMSSNFVAGSLAVFLFSVIIYLITKDERFTALAGVGFVMMVPFSVMFTPSKHKNALLYYAAGMAIVGTISIGIAFSGGEIFNFMTSIFMLGFIAFQWIANSLIIQQNNR